MTPRTIRPAVVAGLLVTCCTAVLAHISPEGVAHDHDLTVGASLAQGLLHPWTGLDHLAAMVSVGVWSMLGLARRDRISTQASVWMPPVAFALFLLLGGILGMAGLSLPGLEPMVAASLLTLGLLVAARARLSAGLGAGLVAVFALFHGLAHGQELSGHAWAALLGMVLSTAVLHAAGMGLGWLLHNPQRPARRWLSSALGVGVAAWGLSLLSPTVAAVL